MVTRPPHSPFQGNCPGYGCFTCSPTGSGNHASGHDVDGDRKIAFGRDVVQHILEACKDCLTMAVQHLHEVACELAEAVREENVCNCKVGAARDRLTEAQIAQEAQQAAHKGALCRVEIAQALCDAALTAVDAVQRRYPASCK